MLIQTLLFLSFNSSTLLYCQILVMHQTSTGGQTNSQSCVGLLLQEQINCLMHWRDFYSLVCLLSQRHCPFSPSHKCFPLSLKKTFIFSPGISSLFPDTSFMGLAEQGLNVMSTEWKGQTVHMTLHSAPQPVSNFKKCSVQNSKAGLSKAACALLIMQPVSQCFPPRWSL